MFFSPLEQYDVLFFYGKSFYFFFIPNFIVPLFLVIILIYFFVFIFYKDIFILASFWQTLFENIILFVLRIIKQQTGPLGFIYTPLILTFFLIILSCNLLSLTPFSLALASHISIVAFVTFTVNLAIFIQGFITNQSKFLSLYVPESPLLLLILLIPIEIFSYSIRALSMGIRLTANIIAGHTLVFIVSSFLSKIFVLKVVFVLFLYALLFSIFFLEIGVAFLQAYVFIVLFCIYLNDSLNLPQH